jgi:hypothetical protein
MPHRTDRSRGRRQPPARPDVVELREHDPVAADWIYHPAVISRSLRRRFRRQTQRLWTPLAEQLRHRTISWSLPFLPDNFNLNSYIRLQCRRFSSFEFAAYVLGTYSQESWFHAYRFPYGVLLEIPNGVVFQGVTYEGPTLGFVTIRRITHFDMYLVFWVPLPLFAAGSDIPTIPVCYQIPHTEPRLVIVTRPGPNVMAPIDYYHPLYEDNRRMILEEIFRDHHRIPEVPTMPAHMNNFPPFTPPGSHTSIESQSDGSHSSLHHSQ